MLRWLRLAIGTALTAFALSTCPAFAAGSNNVNVTATVNEHYTITYTGDECLTFSVNKGGSLTLSNQGDLSWTVNTTGLNLKISRTQWTKDGSQGYNNDLILKVRADEPTWRDWHTVGTTESIWEPDLPAGSHTLPGLDWKVLNTQNGPLPTGVYHCCVTFSIEN